MSEDVTSALLASMECSCEAGGACLPPRMFFGDVSVESRDKGAESAAAVRIESRAALNEASPLVGRLDSSSGFSEAT